MRHPVENPTKRLKIGISGSYGGINLGDEAILDGILSQLRATVAPHITVFSRNPSDTLARHNIERAVAVRQLTRKEITPEVRKLDLLILGGGGILYDRDAEIYLREVFLAQEFGIPVMIYAISAGPLTRPSEAVRTALNACAIVTVRDRLGYRLLEDVGVTREIQLTADPSLLLQPEELPIDVVKSEGIRFDRDLVGFSVREPGPAAPDIDPVEYYALLANAADFVVERLNADVVFIPMETTDIRHSHAVAAHMKNAERGQILRSQYRSKQILDLMGRFEFVIGMRLHFLIFAALRGTPFVALPYASKVMGLLEDLGMETPELESVGIGSLLARIDRTWDTRKEIRARIAQRLPPLQDRAKETNNLLTRYLEERVFNS
jgi:polysaccharide pyruvyl transferase CsaB